MFDLDFFKALSTPLLAALEVGLSPFLLAILIRLARTSFSQWAPSIILFADTEKRPGRGREGREKGLRDRERGGGSKSVEPFTMSVSEASA